jgi:G3E family GTPase
MEWDSHLPGDACCDGGEHLLRVKDLLNLAGQDRPMVIQGVQHILREPTLLREWPDGDVRRSRLVFMTRDLDRSVIEQTPRHSSTQPVTRMRHECMEQT